MNPIRQIESLHPVMREAVRVLQAELATGGLPFRLYEALRGRERQEAGFRAGKSKARMWGSYHNVGLAADFVGHVGGRWSWSDALPWPELGAAARRCGLVWGGDWSSFVDRPHVQLELAPRDGRAFDPALCACKIGEWTAWTTDHVMPMLDMGVTVDWRVYVQAVQAALNYCGAELVVDGVEGPKTRSALAAIVGSGKIESSTWSAVVAAVGAR